MGKLIDFFKNKFSEFTFGEWALLADFLLIIFCIKNHFYELYPICIIVGVILAIYLFLKKINKDHKQYDAKNSNYESENTVDFRDCILALAAKVMNYDGKQTYEELEKVKNIIQRYYITIQEQNEALHLFGEFIKDPNLIYGKYCDYINEKLDYAEKCEIIMELMAVAYADGQYLSSEEYIIKTIVNRLNIPDKEYDRINAIFKVKHKNGNYNNRKNSRSDEHTTPSFNFLVLLAEVMKADGRQMSCEEDCIKDIIKDTFKTKEAQKDALKQLNEILKNEYDLESVCINLKYELDDQDKTELVKYLLEVIYSDNVNTNEEDETLNKILKYLNISSKEYYNIRKNFQKRYSRRSSNSSHSNKNSNQRENSGYKKDDSNKNYNRDNGDSSDSKGNTNYHKNLMSGKEAFDILGVDTTASDEEIRKAYRAMAIKYHPDKVNSLGDEAIRQATETMKQINIAYDVIKMSRGMK